MRDLQSLHNKTQEVTEEGLPYNIQNVLLMETDLQCLFANHGLENIQFHNVNLYRNAFIHRSYCTMKNADFVTGNERCPTDCIPLQEMSYERLEFLGDAILGMVVAKYLFERYPDQNEGFLSMMRTKIVNGKMLGSLGKKIGFDKFVLISKQIEEAGGRTNYKTLEDVFEAFIAAIYLDYQSDEDMPTMPSTLSALIPLSGSGFHMAETWIVTILEKYIDFVELIQTQTNYKDMLSKYMQNNLKDMPRFYEVNIDKRNQKNNSSVFTYCVKDKSGAVIGTAKGTSKKDAENNAALVALEYYGQNL